MVNMPFRHPVTVMQCDVTTNVADAIILLCLLVRGRCGREEVVNMTFHHPVTVMQCDVTTNVGRITPMWLMQ